MENRLQELSKTRQSDETEQQRQVRAGLARLFLPLFRFYLPLGLPGFRRSRPPALLPSPPFLRRRKRRGGGAAVSTAAISARWPMPEPNRPSAIFHSTFLVQD